jgi:DNA polymerase elongation subunit (family B)
METTYLVFDLETVGHDLTTFDEVQQEYLLRKAETDEDRSRLIGEFALSPITGAIVTIGMRLMTRPASSGSDAAASEWTAKDVAYQVDASMADDDGYREEALPSGGVVYFSSERTMLQNFWRLLETNYGIHLVSFNGRGFDAPWLMLRSAVLGIRPTRNLMEGTKFNYRGHTDLLDELTFYSRSASGATRVFNFDFYAKAFGVASPKSAGVDGSKVGDLFRQGALEDIAEYCLRDVRSTWDLFLRWKEVLG